MRRFFFGMLMVLATAFTASASASAQEPRAAITGVIQNQLDAFMADDFATAFAFASPNIKRIFGSPDRFGQMVRNGYPMVWRPGDVSFLELEEVNGRLYQKVLITDLSGVPHVLAYQMVETENGWQINGVQILQAPQIGA